jgi:hypothetical protein
MTDEPNEPGKAGRWEKWFLSWKPFEVITVVIALMALLPAGCTLFSLNSSLESEAYGRIITGLSEYDERLIENAELMPYLEGDQDGREVPLSSADAGKVRRIVALANYKLDFIDGFYSQEGHINWDLYSRCGWETYFRDSFRRSEALCALICSNPLQYGTHVSQLGVSVCQEKTSARIGACAEGAPSISLPPETAACVQ